MGSGVNRRTLAQVNRGGKDMKLELGAKALVKALKEVLLSDGAGGSNGERVVEHLCLFFYASFESSRT